MPEEKYTIVEGDNLNMIQCKMEIIYERYKVDNLIIKDTTGQILSKDENLVPGMVVDIFFDLNRPY